MGQKKEHMDSEAKKVSQEDNVQAKAAELESEIDYSQLDTNPQIDSKSETQSQ